MKKLEILILLRSLNEIAGGVEKSVINLCEELTANSCIVSIVTLDRPGARSFFPIPKNVHWVTVGGSNPRLKASMLEKISRLRRIRKIVKSGDFDVAIGFQAGPFAQLVLATIFIRIKLIATERENLTKYKFLKKGKKKKWLHFFFLIFADAIQVFFPRNIGQYPEYFKNRIFVIPNRTKLNGSIFPEKRQGSLKLLFIGRLDFPKNVELLIRAVLLTSAHLTIVGEGSESIDLKHKFSNCDRIEFVNQTFRVEKLYGSHDYLINVSLWEGFPNVVLEALASGLPVLGFTSTPGVFDLVQHGKDGLLSCEDISELSIVNLIHQAEQQRFSQFEIQQKVLCQQIYSVHETWPLLFRKVVGI